MELVKAQEIAAELAVSAKQPMFILVVTDGFEVVSKHAYETLFEAHNVPVQEVVRP